ncbi:hypothetical protein SDC9_210582 [bioreactor metagenome]|uniref:Uncharacterized protein n=1 Tax=bioreactor metagenome TaxID=1076179 RepID=A0A645JJE7_9ZZZZ
MIIRQVKEKQWECLCRQIITRGRTAPLSLQYDMEIICNGVDYILKVQPVKKRKIAVLQAMGVYPDGGRTGGKDYRLIEDNSILSALLEIMIYQSAEKQGV